MRKAYVNTLPQRSLYAKLPSELGLGACGKHRKCMYETRGAGAQWEATFTKDLLDMGCQQGVAPPACFHHKTWGVP